MVSPASAANATTRAAIDAHGTRYSIPSGYESDAIAIDTVACWPLVSTKTGAFCFFPLTEVSLQKIPGLTYDTTSWSSA